MRTQRIVCAAILYDNGVMLVGPRHLDHVMQKQYVRYFANPTPENPAPTEEEGTFGFLDDDGQFLDRFEAFKVAQSANQIREKHFKEDRLYSEDLY